jgi:hypothetical protein
MPNQAEAPRSGERSFVCIRCGVPMKYIRNVGFHPGIPDSAAADPFSLNPYPDSWRYTIAATAAKLNLFKMKP